MATNDLSTAPRIIVADDDPTIRTTLKRRLARAGYAVSTAASGAEAVALYESRPCDAVVTDIDMPGSSGVELLRVLRARDADLPVILITGHATLQTAVEAVTHGALRYLQKPVDPEELMAAVSRAVDLRQLARVKREALRMLEREARTCAKAELHESFERALGSLWMAFQPIVSWTGRCVHAYEALVRCKEPSIPHPGALIDAAERLGRVHELGRHIRAAVAASIPRLTGDELVFVNLHPLDLADETLGAPDDPLTKYASRVVLEVTERARLDGLDKLAAKLERLRSCGYRIAIDDLGAGYAGLNSFVQLRPEVVKIDMTLVRNIDADPQRKGIVGVLLAMCSSLEVRAVVEGVETDAEMVTLADLGADLMQGYAFGRPQQEFLADALDVASLLGHSHERRSA